MKSPTHSSATEAPTRGRPPFKAGATLRNLALTQPHYVRDVAARLFNQSLKRWSRRASVTDARALLALLVLTRDAVADVQIEAHIRDVEVKLAKAGAQDAVPAVAQAAAAGSKVPRRAGLRHGPPPKGCGQQPRSWWERSAKCRG